MKKRLPTKSYSVFDPFYPLYKVKKSGTNELCLDVSGAIHVVHNLVIMACM